MTNRTEQDIVKRWKSSELPLVGICCITYNHEKYIAEAIDSFLMQETTFPFEILIGEDCSTDGTMEIIKIYRNLYPNLIKVITSDANVGMQKNFVRTFEACGGNYVALCEGDDFWTSPHKLQKQIDFLDNNPEYSVCCHKSENFNQARQVSINSYPNINQEKEMTIYDLFDTNIANTCTFVYRNQNIKIPSFFENFSLGDWPLHMLHAEHGKIKYFPDCMATYRIHNGGTWTSADRIKKLDAAIEVLETMNRYFEDRYFSAIDRLRTRTLFEKVLCFLDTKEYSKADEIYKYLYSLKKLTLVLKIKYTLKKHSPLLYKCILWIYVKARNS